MAEFLRKKRFLKYNDSRCKKFLSKDFNRKCAYCKIREGDLAGPESFEKDHFFPIAKGGKDDYENMIKNSKYTSNKELLTIPGAVHTDLYDNPDVILFDKIQNFFKVNGVG